MLALLIIELGGLAPPEWEPRVIQASTAIWAVFVVAFAFELAVAPSKTRYLRTHWLAALSLAIPFLRIFRVARAVRVLRVGRVLRGLTLGRTLGALNRARKVLVSFAAISQLAYLGLLAVVVTLTAAAVALTFERGAPGGRIDNYGDALWWATTVVTAGGGAIETATLEGRLVSVLLRLFGLGVVGYLTARLAVFFIGRDDTTDDTRSVPPVDREEARRLREELRAVREELQKWRAEANSRARLR